MWNVLQGKKESLFSVGGKEVLIKAIAYAISNYIVLRFQRACATKLTKCAGPSKA